MCQNSLRHPLKQAALKFFRITSSFSSENWDKLMDNDQSEKLNSKRRRNLFLYTLLAVSSYQLPLGVFYLAKVLHLAKYSYSALNIAYFSYMTCSFSAMVLIRIKQQITKKFIYFILYMQALICVIISLYLFYIMSDLRQLVLIGCMTLLMFVFIQSTLIVSFFSIAITVIYYLTASYIGINYNGQPGLFMREILYILMFIPVCIFIAYMSKRMQDQQKKIKRANLTLKTAHDELAATHNELAATHTELETTHTELEAIHKTLEVNNENMVASIRYAEMIQRSLLPGIERIKGVSSDNMFLWMPKDIVGGDIFYNYADPECSLVALMDCTGHGVPGAFLTMVAYSEIRKIIIDEACRVPSEIIKRLNLAVKNVLHKNDDGSGTNDGLDVAICAIDYSMKRITYAGARIPLFYFKNGTVHKIKGDKQSIGYKDSDNHYEFTNHSIGADTHCSFYLITDGFTDQLGSEKRLRFGTGKFKQLIMENHDQSFSEQRKTFLQTLLSYQGENDQMDDITLIGFRV